MYLKHQPARLLNLSAQNSDPDVDELFIVHDEFTLNNFPWYSPSKFIFNINPNSLFSFFFQQFLT